ncbi:putative ribonuclease H protein [Citrus sinensis]|nr:putative ribonuclease H protein [Citrus sinensis]
MKNKRGKTGQMAIKVDLEKFRCNFCGIVRSRKVLSHLEKSNKRTLYPLIFLSSASREASIDQAYVINKVVDTFCFNSGEKIDTTCLLDNLQTRIQSYLWLTVGKVWDHVLKRTRWALKDGKRVKFWWDLWLREVDNLQSYALNLIPNKLINLCVADFSDNNGNWNWQLFVHLLPNHIILKITAVKAPCANSGEDQCYWAYSNTGYFTAKYAYLSLHQSNNMADNSLWNLAWKWNGPQSIRTFIWLAISNRLKTKSDLHRRHITVDATCCSCGPYLEDTIHSWIYYNLKNMGLIKRDEKWPCIFGVVLWRIWYWRNQFIRNIANISVANIVLDIMHHGARKISGHASAGGLIRNYCGEWVLGFGMNIGHFTVTRAELWGLFQGLQLAWNIGIRQLQVEVDNRHTTEILATNNSHPNAYPLLFRELKDYLTRIGSPCRLLPGALERDSLGGRTAASLIEGRSTSTGSIKVALTDTIYEKVSGNGKLINFKSDYVFMRYACAEELKSYCLMDFGLFGRSWAPTITRAVVFVPGVLESNWRDYLPASKLNVTSTGALRDVVASGSTGGNYRRLDKHGGYETAVHGVRTMVRLDDLKVDRRVLSGGSLVLQINLTDPRDGGNLLGTEFTFDGQVYWNLYSN